jgi:feruloyl-CoA synthase
MSQAPLVELEFAPPAVESTPLAGGGMVLRSPMPLGTYPPNICTHLRRWADEAPERLFLAQRRGDGGWRKLTYGETKGLVEGIAQALLDRDVAPRHPVMILSDNGIDHALLALAAMYVGIPVAPVSPAYSLLSQDHARLRHIFARIAPRLLYAANGRTFAKALAVLDLAGVELVVSDDPPDTVPATRFDELAATTPGPAVAAAFDRVGPDTVAKVLFTSGSTGMPKGVINTQRMLCANQQAIAQVWPFLAERPPVIVDWLPWNHTFGGNHNFNMVLRNGGSLYIDEGKPAPGLIDKTIANLREVSPTLYFNVPRGFDVLIPYFEADAALLDTFFARLDLIFFAGSALPQPLWERLEKLSVAAKGMRVRLVSAWGSTETSPLVTSVHFAIDRANIIGLPAPGSELKLVPNGGKLEMRVRGPNVTPGYWQDAALTRSVFDEEGFYRIGDAGKLADPADPVKGVVFDGRIAEDFKLMSGTWVHVGTLRIAALAAAAPVLQDAVVTGHDREEVGLLAFANPAGCLSLCPDVPKDAPLARLIGEAPVRAHLRRGLARHNAANPGSSTRISRVLLLATPPSIDANEITDKGYINQRAVLDCRADEVARLYSDDPEVIRVEGGS